MASINSKKSTAAGWWDARLFATLLVAALIGSAAIFPYALQLTGINLDELGVNRTVAWIASTLQSTLLATVAILAGMRLGPAVSLGPRRLRALLRREPGAWGYIRPGIVWAVPLGAAAALVIVLLDFTLFSMSGAAVNLADSTLPPAWMGLLASFYGGVVEELLMRLGLMTLLVWLVSKIPGVKDAAGWPVWVGIFGAALLFGAGHLPATAAIAPLTPMLVLRALLLNGIPGVIFGWLYAKNGLLAAIASHFTADICLHVLLPLLKAAW